MHGANIKHKIIICFIVVPPLVGKIGKKPLFHVDIVYIGNAGSRTTFVTCGGTFYIGGLSKCPPRYGGTNHTTIAMSPLNSIKTRNIKIPRGVGLFYFAQVYAHAGCDVQ